MPYEADLVRNVLHLDRLTTREIMTPRPVVEKLAAELTLREVAAKVNDWTYSRIPIYDADDPETWTWNRMDLRHPWCDPHHVI